MALVVLGTARSSPGVTTAVLALGAVWSRAGREPLVVEADPDGGVLAARYGLSAHPNLTELAGRTRAGLRPMDAWDHAQMLSGGLGVVVAHPSAEQTHAALRTGAAQIGEHLDMVDRTDVLVDAGRLSPSSPALALVESASLVVVVLRPRLDEISALSHRLLALQGAAEVRILLVGEHPYRAAEVEANLGVEVVGVLADDPKGAAAVGGRRGIRRIGTSTLLRSAVPVAAALAARLDTLDARAAEGGLGDETHAARGAATGRVTGAEGSASDEAHAARGESERQRADDEPAMSTADEPAISRAAR
jgi:hypothetical protein